MAKRGYSDEEKAAVLTALLTGQSVNQVAKEYKIPKGTISSWQKREQEKLSEIRQDAAQQLNGGHAQSDFGRRLANYMEKSIDSLTSQVEVMGEKAYLREKGVQELAMAHGIQMDKLIRILEAMNRDQPESQSAEN